MKWVVRILTGLIVLAALPVAGLWVWGMRPNHDHVVAEVLIDRSAPQVFLWLTEDDRVRKWVGGIGEIKQISAPADGGQVGRKFQVAEVYKDQSVSMEMTVTRYEKDRALSLQISSLGDPSNGFTEAGDYTLAKENGKTRLRFDVKTKYLGFVPRLFEPLITPEANKKLAEDFQRLKQLAEAEPVMTVAGDAAAQFARIRFFLGDWAYSEEYTNSSLFPKGGKNSGWWKSQMSPDGSSLMNSFELKGSEPYKGREEVFWDPKQSAYVVHTFEGDSPDVWTVLIGNFEGDALVSRSEFEMHKKKVKFRSEIRPLPEGGFTYDEFASVEGGKEETILKGVAKKK